MKREGGLGYSSKLTYYARPQKTLCSFDYARLPFKTIATYISSFSYNEVLRSDSHTAVVRDNTVCDNFVDNLVILINLFPWIGTVEQPIEVQTNLVLCNIAYIAYKFSTPVIKNELIILSIQFDMKAATRVQKP